MRNNKLKSNVLVVAAHPDDELLGMGGTILKHTKQGGTVQVLFLSDGESSRNKSTVDNDMSGLIQERKKAAYSAAKILRTNAPIFLDYPDNRLDEITLLDIIKKIEIVIDDIKPEIIYTHYENDLNIDHQITHNAVLTASRPVNEISVKSIYSFEIPSSTEWNFSTKCFNPNVFVDISGFYEEKLKALSCYNKEMKTFPHPRSKESIQALARYRGSMSGLHTAESFMLVRDIID